MTNKRSPDLVGRAFLRKAFLLGVLWFVFLALPAAASNLVGLAPVAVPAIPQAPTQLISVNGGALALGKDQAWQLVGPSKGWQPLRWSVTTSLAGVRSAVSEGNQLWLLTGDAGSGLKLITARVEGGSVIDAAAIAPLPFALRDGRLSFANGVLSLAGVDASGKPQLLQHDDGGWHVLTAWPGGSNVQALLAQGARLYLVAGSVESPQLSSWSPDEGWRALGALPGAIVPGSAQALGQAHLMFLVRGQPDLRTFHTITHSWNSMPLASA